MSPAWLHGPKHHTLFEDMCFRSSWRAQSGVFQVCLVVVPSSSGGPVRPTPSTLVEKVPMPAASWHHAVALGDPQIAARDVARFKQELWRTTSTMGGAAAAQPAPQQPPVNAQPQGDGSAS